MRFGLFGGAQAPRTTTEGDLGSGFREYVATSVEAERLGFHSTFLVEHHFSGSGQVSAPLDLLHPPVWIAAGRPASVRRVAALGANLLLDQFAPIEAIGERIALFEAECEARGRRFDPMDVGVARNLYVYVARDTEDASAALAQQARIRRSASGTCSSAVSKPGRACSASPPR